MNIILFDTKQSKLNFEPLTFIRPIALFRLGILTIKEKWERYLIGNYSVLTESYLAKKFPLLEKDNQTILIDATICPDQELSSAINTLEVNEKLVTENHQFIACKCLQGFAKTFYNKPQETVSQFKRKIFQGKIHQIKKIWDLILFNKKELEKDFNLLTKTKNSQPVKDKHTQLYNPDNIFIDKDVQIKSAILNAEKGPIYIGKSVKIQEGVIIQGPVSILEGSQINMQTQVYDATTIGPHSKIGGEIKNTIIFGYTNKAHCGFLGNSVIGEWCNIGAGSNTANLKNDYCDVKIWNPHQYTLIDTGLKKCGIFMGDHTKTGINSMFLPGTVIGINVNLFGSGYTEQFVPSFTWGGADMPVTTYRLNKAFATATNMMERRNILFTKRDQEILLHVFRTTFMQRFKKKLEQEG